jgi:3-methyl-2-oxobutanoate hydroxymethyltransferase
MLYGLQPLTHLIGDIPEPCLGFTTSFLFSFLFLLVIGLAMSSYPSPSASSLSHPLTLPHLHAMAKAGEKIAALTAYDATFAVIADQAGIDILLVGDSAGMVCQGLPSTVGVTLKTLCHYTENVARGLAQSVQTSSATGRAFLIADLPYGTYAQSPEQAYASSCALMRAGAHMVKLEGGQAWAVDTVAFLVERSIPVCGHIGLTPQSVHALGGYRLQGKTPETAQTLVEQALALQAAGAGLLVLEMVPCGLARQITDELNAKNPLCPTIGIGAGSATNGQILVMHDMLGLRFPGRSTPRFVKDFLALANDSHGSIENAFALYVQAVKTQQFPIDSQHGF